MPTIPRSETPDTIGCCVTMRELATHHDPSCFSWLQLLLHAELLRLVHWPSKPNNIPTRPIPSIFLHPLHYLYFLPSTTPLLLVRAANSFPINRNRYVPGDAMSALASASNQGPISIFHRDTVSTCIIYIHTLSPISDRQRISPMTRRARLNSRSLRYNHPPSHQVHQHCTL